MAVTNLRPFSVPCCFRQLIEFVFGPLGQLYRIKDSLHENMLFVSGNKFIFARHVNDTKSKIPSLHFNQIHLTCVKKANKDQLIKSLSHKFETGFQLQRWKL